VIAAANIGDVVGNRYQVVKLIGRGAMADVFAAHDHETGASVALKILRDAIARDPEASARFSREAQAHQRIRHPNAAVLYGAGVAGAGQPYLVLELVQGRSLAHKLKEEGRIEARRAAGYVAQALCGLAATHAAGVVHRDLKPGNLMLEVLADHTERVVVIDFGFAAFEGGPGITRQGFVVGSLSYIAPERLRGEPVDERSDLYSMGVIFYELVTGRLPFSGEDDSAVITGHLDEPPPPLSVVAPDVAIPPALEAVLLRALSKYPDERAASAADMARELALASTAR
jgi:serine/threonine-protein kinase